MNNPGRLAVTELNPHLICSLCGGYYIEATTIIECLHTFCKSCIVRYLESSKFCPTCDVQVHKTNPLLSIRPDKTLQNVVYKLVPGLYKNEMYRRKRFYAQHSNRKPASEEDGGNHMNQPYILPDDPVSVALKPIKTDEESLHAVRLCTRFFSCPAGVTIAHLKKLLRAKFDLPNKHPVILVSTEGEILQESYSLIDVAYIRCWEKREPLLIYYKICFTKKVKFEPEILDKKFDLEVKTESVINVRCTTDRPMPKLESQLELSHELCTVEEKNPPRLSPCKDEVKNTKSCVVVSSSSDTINDPGRSNQKSIDLRVPFTTSYKTIVPAPAKTSSEVVHVNPLCIPTVDAIGNHPSCFNYGLGVVTSSNGMLPGIIPGNIIDPTKLTSAILPFGLTLAPSLICTPYPDHHTLPNVTLFSPDTTSAGKLILPLSSLDTSVVHSVSQQPISSIMHSDALQPQHPPVLLTKDNKKPKLIRPKEDPKLKPDKEVQLMITESGLMMVSGGEHPSNHLEGVLNTVESEANELLNEIENGSLLISNENCADDSNKSDGSDGGDRLAQIKHEISTILDSLSEEVKETPVTTTLQKTESLRANNFSVNFNTSSSPSRCKAVVKSVKEKNIKIDIKEKNIKNDIKNKNLKNDGKSKTIKNDVLSNNNINNKNNNNNNNVVPLKRNEAPKVRDKCIDAVMVDCSQRKSCNKVLCPEADKGEKSQHETVSGPKNSEGESKSTTDNVNKLKGHKRSHSGNVCKENPQTASPVKSSISKVSGAVMPNDTTHSSAVPQTVSAITGSISSNNTQVAACDSAPIAKVMTKSINSITASGASTVSTNSNSMSVKEASKKKENRKIIPKGYKKLRKTPKLWNPTISREKLQRKIFQNSSKPNKFFKARNSIASENLPSSQTSAGSNGGITGTTSSVTLTNTSLTVLSSPVNCAVETNVLSSCKITNSDSSANLSKSNSESHTSGSNVHTISNAKATASGKSAQKCIQPLSSPISVPVKSTVTDVHKLSKKTGTVNSKKFESAVHTHKNNNKFDDSTTSTRSGDKITPINHLPKSKLDLGDKKVEASPVPPVGSDSKTKPNPEKLSVDKTHSKCSKADKGGSALLPTDSAHSKSPSKKTPSSNLTPRKGLDHNMISLLHSQKDSLQRNCHFSPGSDILDSIPCLPVPHSDASQTFLQTIASLSNAQYQGRNQMLSNFSPLHSLMPYAPTSYDITIPRHFISTGLSTPVSDCQKKFSCVHNNSATQCMTCPSQNVHTSKHVSSTADKSGLLQGLNESSSVSASDQKKQDILPAEKRNNIPQLGEQSSSSSSSQSTNKQISSDISKSIVPDDLRQENKADKLLKGSKVTETPTKSCGTSPTVNKVKPISSCNTSCVEKVPAASTLTKEDKATTSAVAVIMNPLVNAKGKVTSCSSAENTNSLSSKPSDDMVCISQTQEVQTSSHSTPKTIKSSCMTSTSQQNSLDALGAVSEGITFVTTTCQTTPCRSQPSCHMSQNSSPASSVGSELNICQSQSSSTLQKKSATCSKGAENSVAPHVNMCVTASETFDTEKAAQDSLALQCQMALPLETLASQLLNTLAAEQNGDPGSANTLAVPQSTQNLMSNSLGVSPTLYSDSSNAPLSTPTSESLQNVASLGKPTPDGLQNSLSSSQKVAVESSPSIVNAEGEGPIKKNAAIICPDTAVNPKDRIDIRCSLSSSEFSSSASWPASCTNSAATSSAALSASCNNGSSFVADTSGIRCNSFLQGSTDQNLLACSKEKNVLSGTQRTNTVCSVHSHAVSDHCNNRLLCDPLVHSKNQHPVTQELSFGYGESSTEAARTQNSVLGTAAAAEENIITSADELDRLLFQSISAATNRAADLPGTNEISGIKTTNKESSCKESSSAESLLKKPSSNSQRETDNPKTTAPLSTALASPTLSYSAPSAVCTLSSISSGNCLYQSNSRTTAGFQESNKLNLCHISAQSTKSSHNTVSASATGHCNFNNKSKSAVSYAQITTSAEPVVSYNESVPVPTSISTKYAAGFPIMSSQPFTPSLSSYSTDASKILVQQMCKSNHMLSDFPKHLTPQHSNVSEQQNKSDVNQSAGSHNKTDMPSDMPSVISSQETSTYNAVNNVSNSPSKKTLQSSTSYSDISQIQASSAKTNYNQSMQDFSSLSFGSPVNNFHDGISCVSTPGLQPETTQKQPSQFAWDGNALNSFFFNSNTFGPGNRSFSSNTNGCVQQNLFRNNETFNKDASMTTDSQTGYMLPADSSCAKSSTSNAHCDTDTSAKKNSPAVDSYNNLSVASQKYSSHSSLYNANYNNNYMNFFSNSQAQVTPSLTSLVSGTGYNFPLSNSKFTGSQQYFNFSQNCTNNSSNFNVNCGSNYQNYMNQGSGTNAGSNSMNSNFGNNFSGSFCNFPLSCYPNCSFSYNSYPYFYQGGDMSLFSNHAAAASLMPSFSSRSSLSPRNASSQSFNDLHFQSGLFPVMPFVSPLSGNSSRGAASPMSMPFSSPLSMRPFPSNTPYPQKMTYGTHQQNSEQQKNNSGNSKVTQSGGVKHNKKCGNSAQGNSKQKSSSGINNKLNSSVSKGASCNDMDSREVCASKDLVANQGSASGRTVSQQRTFSDSNSTFHVKGSDGKTKKDIKRIEGNQNQTVKELGASS